jgi:kynurenine formamidase
LLVGPAVLVDVTEAAACDADYLVSVSDLEGAVERSGPLAPGSWIVLRTGWEARYEDPAAYLNKDDSGCHWPGLAAEAAEWLAGQPIAGFGTDTIGIDAGIGRLLEPSNPAHSLLLGAGKCGLASLNNLSLLPRSGWVLIAAPLKMTGGSGSPMRALALVTAG